MDQYSVTDARAQLPLLLTSVADGKPITILRHGQPVAVLVAHDQWMRSQARSRVIDSAKKLAELREASSKKSWDEIGWLSSYDADAHIAEIRKGRDGGALPPSAE